MELYVVDGTGRGFLASAGMNENHAQLCPSPEWAAFLQNEVLPALTGDVDLGDRMLEIGPGPGAATAWLRRRVSSLVAVETDADAAAALRGKYPDVDVRHGDGARLAFAGADFDSVGCFTMLHHVPTAEQQDAILSEACRVLRPGGVLIGSDSLASDELAEFHEGDTYNPLDPDTVEMRLKTAGFERVDVRVDGWLGFVAYAPAAGAGA